MDGTTKIPDQAVDAAQLAEDALERAVRLQQQDSDPAHEDFYAYGATLRGIAQHMSSLARVLSHQVERYGDSRLLRADDDSDPYARLTEARAALDELRQAVDGSVYPPANSYQSAIGHVAVEVNP